MSKANQTIADIYDLSPMQQGMLFHSLQAPGSGLYHQQLVCAISGNLDVDAFQTAWCQVIARHTALRSAFMVAKSGKMVQVVHRSVESPWQLHDWRQLTDEEQQHRLVQHLADDRQRGFDLHAAPLLRLALCQLADDHWQFIWSHHHLLLDGWSLATVVSDVMKCYHANQQGLSPDLPSVRPYRDYIAWLQQQDSSAAEAFWREQLAGVSAPTPLGGDGIGVRETTDESRYAKESITLSATLTAKLTTMVQRQRLTLSTLVQGAWALLLSQYSGEETVVFGSVVSGRPATLPGVETTCGLFINTLPVRVDVTPQMEVANWLDMLQRQQVSLRQYEYSSLTDIQQWSLVPHGTSLFDSIIAFESYPLATAVENGTSSSGMTFRVTDVAIHEQTNYALTLISAPATCLPLSIRYDTHRFSEEIVRQILRHLAHLLEEIAEHPEQQLVALSVCEKDERTRLLDTWNETASAYPADRSVHELFECWAERTPDAVAVTAASTALSYRDLNARANQLAHWLRRQGVGAETLVGLSMKRSPETIVAILGVLKAGGAYVPMDPTYPTERLAFMLADTQVSILLTQSDVAACLPDTAARIVRLDTDWPTMAAEPTTNLPSVITPDNLAYVIYTSGSTGRPKGALLTHAGLTSLMSAQQEFLQISASSRVLQFASLSFDASVWEIFMALTHGATLCLRPEDCIGGEELLAWMDAEGITATLLPPALLASIEHPAGRGPATLLTGGDDCPVDLAKRWAPGRRLLNVYGPTECTVINTIYSCPPDITTHPPIGRPLANTRVYVLDAFGRPLPVGVAGELYIAGVGLARGYLHRPELTDERFLPDPFSPVPHARMYRTGDRVRWLPDGNIEFLGRLDHQVKIRGFRIELGEIETALRQSAGIVDAVVVTRNEPNGEKGLVAFVVSDRSPETLRQALQTRLPAYMLPSAFIMLEMLPLTTSGKVDRKALQAMAIDTASDARATAYEAPQTPTEEQLAILMAKVLNQECVGRQDNFFELGGHSLRAVALMNAIQREMGRPIALKEVLQSPRLADLARVIDTAAGKVITPIPDAASYPLSAAQQRLWTLQCMDRENVAYNIPLVAQLDGILDPQRLAKAFTRLVERHESLRTRYTHTDGVPSQIVEPPCAIPWVYEDLSAWSDAETLGRARIYDDAQRPFDLEQALPLRVLLFRTAPQRHLLGMTLHHIAADGWSMQVFLRELGQLYTQIESSTPLPLLAIQYRDYAAWQRNRLDGPAGEEERHYWTQKLADPPVLALPTDRPRPQEKTYHGRQHHFVISADELHQLQAVADAHHVSVFVAVTTLVNVLLHRYCRAEDIIVGTPVAGRERPELAEQIGLYVNTLALRNHISASDSFTELLQHVAVTVDEALRHQGYPFDRLLDDLHLQRDLARSPLFDVMVTMQNLPTMELPIPGIQATALPTESTVSKFDISFTFAEEASELICELEYNTDLFDAVTAERMGEHFLCLLRDAVTTPSRPVGKLNMLSAEEQQYVLNDLNHTTRPIPDGTDLITRLAELAVRYADAPAVVCGNNSLTFAELVWSARNLAGQLRRLGVQRGSVIGVAHPRSFDQVIAFFGVLWAGGVYLPLNLEYPDSRLQFMLADAGCTLVCGNAEAATRLADSKIPVLTPESWTPDEETNATAHEVDSEALAYIIYTSGSTGQPKGVRIFHRALINYALWAADEFHLGTGDVTLPLASTSFDASISELVYGLFGGSALALLPPGEERLPSAVVAALTRYQVTSIQVTPSLLDTLLAYANEHGTACFASLRQILVGGERLPADLLRRFEQQIGTVYGTRLCNVYGPTETTIDAACHWCAPVDGLADEVPIGRPIANTRLYVLEPSGHPAPLGVPGEIYIAGTGVAHDYLQRPELTEHSFLPDPYVDGARMYRSGDLGRWRPDGTLAMLGRIDQQIKLRGYRIELGEIETALRAVPDIRQAVVLADTERGRLTAYLVTTVSLNEAEIRTTLAARLPNHMIPSLFRSVEEIPLTAHGKVDIQRLQTMGHALQADCEQRAAVSPTEQALVDIWRDVLAVPDMVSIDDNFFEIGGNSLLLVRCHSLIEHQWPGRLAIADLFRYPTIATLAQALDSADDHSPVQTVRLPDTFAAVETTASTVHTLTVQGEKQQAIEVAAQRFAVDSSTIWLAAYAYALYMTTEDEGPVPVYLVREDETAASVQFDVQQADNETELVRQIANAITTDFRTSLMTTLREYRVVGTAIAAVFCHQGVNATTSALLRQAGLLARFEASNTSHSLVIEAVGSLAQDEVRAFVDLTRQALYKIAGIALLAMS